MFHFVGIGRGEVDFFNITVCVGTGVLFIAQVKLAIFANPAGIRIFAGCGFGQDIALFIHFYGLALLAAGGVNNGGINYG